MKKQNSYQEQPYQDQQPYQYQQHSHNNNNNKINSNILPFISNQNQNFIINNHKNNKYLNQIQISDPFQQSGGSATALKVHIPKPKRFQKQQKIRNDINSHQNLNQYSNKYKNKQQKVTLKYKPQELISKLFNNIQIQRKSKEVKQLQTRKQKDFTIIAQILSYILGQYHINQKLLGQQKVIYDWEVQQLDKHYQDSQLGDYIIKLPNPDNLPSIYATKYQVLRQQENSRSKTIKIDLRTALQQYRQMFHVEDSTNIHTRQNQQIAFALAFYFMDIKNKSIKPQDQRYANGFCKIFQYSKKIKKLSFSQYIKIRREKKIMDAQNHLPQQLQIELNQILLQKQKDDKMQRRFSLYKQVIEKSQKAQIKQYFYNIKQEKPSSVFSYYHSIGSILGQYPQLMERAIRTVFNFDQYQNNKRQQDQQSKMKNQNSTNNKKQRAVIQRKLFSGQTLKKQLAEDKFVWNVNYRYPKDVMTLLRKFLQYKLSIKGLLYTRSFLSKDQKHIFLVIKASQPVMEIHAQTFKMNTQIQLGSTDLFSFQPVDKYHRPLRINKYIRDPQFIKKYNLKLKVDKDYDDKLKSIQSEVVNLFKKAQKMNEDQLRAKIILDQEDADNAYKWISKTLQIQYVGHDQVLTNSFNDQQISKDQWQAYYIYNKMIIQFTKRAQQLYQSQKQIVQNNIGMLLRLMFQYALWMANDTYITHKQEKSLLPNFVVNYFYGDKILKNLWDTIDIKVPTGFWGYIKTSKTQRIWRKYQVNQKKDRSKFFPGQRLFIINKIIQGLFNKGKSLSQLHILDYYPLHDPYILKNIKITPYLHMFKTFKQKNLDSIKAQIKKRQQQVKINNENKQSQKTFNILSQVFSQYQSPYTQADFTKLSVEQKMKFRIGQVTSFATQTVRYYCGQKIALYFQYVRFLTVQSSPLAIISFIFQILLWVQQGNIASSGTSTLTSFNNVLIFIFTFINIVWTTHALQKWRSQQTKLGQTFGVTNLSQQDEKRAKFQGSFKRNFLSDELNYQYIPVWKSLLKTIFTLSISLSYVAVVIILIMFLFIFKSYLFQSGYNQSTVDFLPSVLIAITVQLCNYIFTLLMGLIADFQNHKTISQYQNSLVSKSYIVTFVLRFYSIFIYAFFSNSLQIGFVCRIRTATGQVIYNCDYFVSNQLLWFVLIDIFTSIVFSFYPYLKFKYKQYRRQRPKVQVKFSVNFFQAIDQFYQQQDQMESYMFNQQLDKSWQAYLSIMTKFTALALFAPALPLSYCMMFFGGLVSLHGGKFEVILLSRRSIPIKVKSINIWLTIMEILSILSIVVNLLYMIYTRKVFVQYQSRVFFILLILFIFLKYYLMLQYETQDDKMGKRNQIKTHKVLIGKGKDFRTNTPQQVNTDIQNIVYDEKKLRRKFPKISKANVRPQAFKHQK